MQSQQSVIIRIHLIDGVLVCVVATTAGIDGNDVRDAGDAAFYRREKRHDGGIRVPYTYDVLSGNAT